MRISSTRRTFAAALLLAMVVAACSDDDGGSATSTSKVATTTATTGGTIATATTPTSASPATTPAGSTGYSVAESLRQIPVAALQDGPVLAMSGDLDRASQLAGVERPAHDADADTVIGWASAITGLPHDGKNSDVAVMPLDVLRFERIAQIDEIREELGWSALDVATYAGVDSPPEHFGSMTGSFDEQQIDAAQGDRTDGIWSLGGEDFTVDLKTVTAARPLGSSLRTALEDGRLGEAASTPAIEAWIGGSKESLADDPAMVAVAEALDEAGVYSAVVIRDNNDDGSTRRPGASTPTGDNALAPFDAFAAGADHDDSGAQIVLAYHCDDATGATHNGEVLRTLFESGSSDRTRQPWSELVTVDDVQVDGQVVVVTLDVLEGRSPSLVSQAILTRESFTISP